MIALQSKFGRGLEGQKLAGSASLQRTAAIDRYAIYSAHIIQILHFEGSYPMLQLEYSVTQ